MKVSVAFLFIFSVASSLLVIVCNVQSVSDVEVHFAMPLSSVPFASRQLRAAAEVSLRRLFAAAAAAAARQPNVTGFCWSWATSCAERSDTAAVVENVG